jgi:hypothetical protein
MSEFTKARRDNLSIVSRQCFFVKCLCKSKYNEETKVIFKLKPVMPTQPVYTGKGIKILTINVDRKPLCTLLLY